MGRFIVEQLAREGVDTRGVKVDPDRLTALVLLGIRDDTAFPLIFYRENCADMGLTEDDIDEGFIAEARAVLATGTHLSHPRTAAAVLKALTLARKHGARTALDIDYRPNLWGVAGHGEGESRFVESAEVTRKLQATLHLFDLIVGTEEEFHIAGGSTDTLEALRAVRAVSDATLVCKRGAKGASAFEGPIPASLDDGQTGPGFPIEVFNVLGAGDGFFSGLLKGWMEDADWPTALKYANVCGAFAVSRHGCTPAYPSLAEMEFFLGRGVVRPDLRNDAALEQIHWSTNRTGAWPEMRVFAFDHRMQLEEMDGRHDREDRRLQAALPQRRPRRRRRPPRLRHPLRQPPRPRRAPRRLRQRPVDRPPRRVAGLPPAGAGTRARLRLRQPCANGRARTWSRCCASATPTTRPRCAAEQEATVKRLWEASRRNALEFLLEIIPSKVGPVDDDTTATLIRQFYAAGIFPDWWKLEPMTARAAWTKAIAAIEENDAHTRGIVVLGLDAPEAALAASFETAAGFDLVKGFAVGRTIFGDVARRWMTGALADDAAVAEMAARYARLCAVWDKARATAREAVA